MKIRNNVSFYTVWNGFSTFFGEGKEITLRNGNTYAIIEGIKYLVNFDGNNCQSFTKI